jgi:hypothetical protein
MTASRPSWTDAEPDEDSFAASLRSEGRAGIPCPSPDLLRGAREGILPGDLQHDVVRHLERCSMCRTLDAAQLEVMDESMAGDAKRRVWNRVSAEIGRQPRHAWVPSWGLLGAAAALVVGLTSAVLYLRPPSEPPINRGTESSAIRSLVAPDAVVPRSACELTWASDLAGARYDVFVTDEDLNALARGSGLDVPRFVVRPQDLAALAPGSRILWRVEALLPGGRRVSSPTFITRVE